MGAGDAGVGVRGEIKEGGVFVDDNTSVSTEAIEDNDDFLVLTVIPSFLVPVAVADATTATFPPTRVAASDLELLSCFPPTFSCSKKDDVKSRNKSGSLVERPNFDFAIEDRRVTLVRREVAEDVVSPLLLFLLIPLLLLLLLFAVLLLFVLNDDLFDFLSTT